MINLLQIPNNSKLLTSERFSNRKMAEWYSKLQQAAPKIWYSKLA